MKLFDEHGKWIFLANDARGPIKGKRAEYLNALKNIIIDIQGSAPDLAKLEMTESENDKKRVIARLELVIRQIELVIQHL